MFKMFDASLYAAWADSLERALSPDEVDLRSRAVVRVALDSVVHFSHKVIEAHIGEAFDAGSNVAELLEAVMNVGWLESGLHGIRDGLESLAVVVEAREKAGLAVP